jgi:signal transduction histidine kinase/CheY-like chemotaxis protein
MSAFPSAPTRLLSSLLTRFGVLGVTLAVSGIVIVISTLITLVVALLVELPLAPALLLASGTPVLLAPPVAYLMARFSELYEAAEAANRAKSGFLSHMSHELHTPLNAILGTAQLLLADARLGEAHREELRIIQESGQHLLGLVNDVLDLRQIETGLVELHPEVFDLHETLQGLVEGFRPRCAGKGLALELRLDPAVPRTVEGDRGKLRQVLRNLVGNAVKFTADGGVTVAVERGPEGVRCQVRDTGPGIPESDLRRLFRPFSRFDRTSAGDGAGLGLSISARFVEAMGGRLTVTSRVGEGSAFTLTLPLPEAQAPPPPAETQAEEVTSPTATARTPPTPVPREGPWRILIVDDDPIGRKVVGKLLQSRQYETEEACNGKEALERFASYRPDLILMDIRMPVMDGLEATRRIRALPGGPKTVIVGLTAYSFNHDLERILAAGCNQVISKPFDFDRLLATLSESLAAGRGGETMGAPAGADG